MVVFPQLRLRRLRWTETIRRLVQETRVEVRDLVYPLFVEEGRGIKQEIPPMQGDLPPISVPLFKLELLSVQLLELEADI